jgi:hypothetical protein
VFESIVHTKDKAEIVASGCTVHAHLGVAIVWACKGELVPGGCDKFAVIVV